MAPGLEMEPCGLIMDPKFAGSKTLGPTLMSVIA